MAVDRVEFFAYPHFKGQPGLLPLAPENSRPLRGGIATSLHSRRQRQVLRIFAAGIAIGFGIEAGMPENSRNRLFGSRFQEKGIVYMRLSVCHQKLDLEYWPLVQWRSQAQLAACTSPSMGNIDSRRTQR